jgi:hypothetical protein
VADEPKDLATRPATEMDRPAVGPVRMVIVEDRKHILTETVTRLDVTVEAAKMHVEIAEQTYAVPRHQTWRTAVIVAGVVGICGFAAACMPGKDLSGVLIAAITTLGGAWGVGQIIDKIKTPPK